MRHSMTCLAVALSATASFAMPTSSLDPCLTPAPKIEEITFALSKAGWQIQMLDALDDTTIEHLAWMRAIDYLTGDSAGESVDDIMVLQRKTVRGLARKAELETSKTRVMTLEQETGQATVQIVWQKPLVGPMQVLCSFTTTEAVPLPVDQNLPLAWFVEAPEGVTQTVLNRAELDTTISTVLETSFSFDAEEM